MGLFSNGDNNGPLLLKLCGGDNVLLIKFSAWGLKNCKLSERPDIVTTRKVPICNTSLERQRTESLELSSLFSSILSPNFGVSQCVG